MAITEPYARDSFVGEHCFGFTENERRERGLPPTTALIRDSQKIPIIGNHVRPQESNGYLDVVLADTPFWTVGEWLWDESFDSCPECDDEAAGRASWDNEFHTCVKLRAAAKLLMGQEPLDGDRPDRYATGTRGVPAQGPSRQSSDPQPLLAAWSSNNQISDLFGDFG